MKRLALTFAGHIRNFRFDNISENFINTLLDNDCVFDYFFSIWDNEGHRSLNFSGSADVNNILSNIQPKGLLIEQFNRDFFINKYNTEKWREYSHLSDHTTCGDSISMWYKIQSCLDMIEKYQKLHGFQYDAIARIRPDVIWENPFSKEVLDDIFINDVLYIPKWNIKWYEVSKTITDYFAIGNYSVMKNYMSVYNNIDTLIASNNCPHTGEGFLSEQLKGVNIKRLNNGFSVQRPNFVEKIV